jgi:hypothetical protein
MRAGDRLRLGATVALELGPESPPKANSGRSAFSANQTTSFFLVSGFGSGAYSAKLFVGTRHRFSGLSQLRQRNDLISVEEVIFTGLDRLPDGGQGLLVIKHRAEIAPAFKEVK